MPGLSQVTNVTGPGTLIYAAPTTAVFTATPTVQVFNNGSSPVWIGNQGVTVNNGLQLNPNSHFRVANMFTSLYACGGVVATATHTALTAASTAGSVVLTVTSGATNYSPGTAILIGNGTGQESAVVVGTATTSITVATALIYDHASAGTVATATVTGGQVSVIPGVV